MAFSYAVNAPEQIKSDLHKLFLLPEKAVTEAPAEAEPDLDSSWGAAQIRRREKRLGQRPSSGASE